MSLVLIGGGSRSGKSRYALDLARTSGSRLAFIATARVEDEEMRARVRRHQQERGPEFTTFEEPIELAARIHSLDGRFDALVADCLTMWLSNLLLCGEAPLEQESERLVKSASAAQARVLLVTGEVGCGIVPDNALARKFRDHAGRLNQLVAAAAQEVYWMAFGIPLRVK